MNAEFKRRVFEFFKGEPRARVRELYRVAEKVCALPERRLSPWYREMIALRLVVAEMRAELLGSQTREKHARYLAFHDDLTGLPNRRYFLERLGVALKGAQSETLNLAIICLDLDGFKLINDTHGHETGDQLLSLIAG